MEGLWDKVVKGIALVAGAIAGIFGGMTTVMYVLLVMMAIDYVSGLLVAFMGKSIKTEGGGLDSKVGFKGLARKGLMLLVVFVASQLDLALGGVNKMFTDMACWFYIANEGISFMENLALAGVPFPEKLKKIFEQAKDHQGKPPDAA